MCVSYISRKSRDLEVLGSREVMVMMKVEMMVAVVVNANFSVRMNMFI